MNCRAYEQDLALAAANFLEPSRARAVRDHCEHCPQCAAKLADLQVVVAAQTFAAREIAGLPRPVAPAFRASRARTYQTMGLSLSWRWCLPVGAAIVVLFILVALHRHESQPTPQLALPRVPHIQPASAGLPSLAAYRQAVTAIGDGVLERRLARDERHLLRGSEKQDLQQLLSEL